MEIKKAKKNKRSIWRNILLISVFLILSVFVLNIDTVSALVKGARAGLVIWRFEREVLRATRVGQYYEGLIFKHAQEAGEILSKNTEDTNQKFSILGEVAIPLLEDYLNGNGDSAIITAEAMKALDDILKVLFTNGSPSLKNDINIQYERFPLSNFVGMSMNEAYDHVLSTASLLIEEPLLVEGTNEKWAYYVYKGIYFEYPSNWYVQIIDRIEENENSIMIIPSSENPDEWDAEWIAIGIATNVSFEDTITHNFTFNTSGYEILWQKTIKIDGMDGTKFAARHKISGAVIGEVYNSEKKIFIEAGVALFDPFGFQLSDDYEVAKKRYEYIFHLIESLQTIEP